MTKEDILKTINILIDRDCKCCNDLPATCWVTDCDTKFAIEALEKQIPKHPKGGYISEYEGGKYNWVCQCGAFFRADELPNYCSRCGQKLDFVDWSWDKDEIN